MNQNMRKYVIPWELIKKDKKNCPGLSANNPGQSIAGATDNQVHSSIFPAERKEKMHKENKTAEFIGKQNIAKIIKREDYEQIKDLYISKGFLPELFHGSVESLMTDAFLLGYIKGKRVERSRKNKKSLDSLLLNMSEEYRELVYRFAKKLAS